MCRVFLSQLYIVRGISRTVGHEEWGLPDHSHLSGQAAPVFCVSDTGRGGGGFEVAGHGRGCLKPRQNGEGDYASPAGDALFPFLWG